MVIKRALDEDGKTAADLEGDAEDQGAPRTGHNFLLDRFRSRSAKEADRLAAENIELSRRVSMLEEELRQERHELVMTAGELRRLRRQAAEAAHQVDRVRNTVSFRLGNAILRAKSLKGVAALPREVRALVNDSRERRRLKKLHGLSSRQLDHRWSGLMEAAPDGADAAIAYGLDLGLPSTDAAQLLVDIAKARRSYDMAAAVRIGRAALDLDDRPQRRRWFATLLYDAGSVQDAAEFAESALASHESFDPAASAKLQVIAGWARVRRGVEVPSRRRLPAYAADPAVVAYVAASSLPHHISGYTTRTHNLIRAIRAEGWDVQPMTRPGYPWDRNDAKDIEGNRSVYEVDGLSYFRIKASSSHETPFDQWLVEASRALVARFTESRASIVHAASNYVNALPALIAARTVGAPFVYEVRGLWELTSAARISNWEATERFALQRDLEALVARKADVVMVLTEGLRDELIQRGVSPTKIRLAPNCVDTERFRPAERDRMLAARLGLHERFVLGFMGSMLDYEGLDDLLEASAAAVDRGVDLALLLVGDGPVADHLREQARALHLEDRLVMPGRVSPADVAAYYSVVDAAVFPRKPFQVCELVSPLKPLEAMAMGKPVIASNVAAIAEFVRHDENGILFAKGDVGALTEAIVRVANTPSLAKRLGEDARLFVEQTRNWSVTAGQISSVYGRLLHAEEPVAAAE